MAIMLGIDKFMCECRALADIAATASRRWSSPPWKARLGRTRMAAALWTDVDPSRPGDRSYDRMKEEARDVEEEG